MSEVISADPSDWLARLARADLLEEQSRLPESYAVRGRAWLWAWASSLPGLSLCFVEGCGRRPLVAHFSPLLAMARGEGFDEPDYLHNALPPSGCMRIIFESPGHDVPADLGRRRRFARLSAGEINGGACAWLLPTRHGGIVALEPGEPRRCGTEPIEPGEQVMAGASIPEFCAAVEATGGWWLPMEG